MTWLWSVCTHSQIKHRVANFRFLPVDSESWWDAWQHISRASLHNLLHRMSSLMWHYPSQTRIYPISLAGCQGSQGWTNLPSVLAQTVMDLLHTLFLPGLSEPPTAPRVSLHSWELAGAYPLSLRNAWFLDIILCKSWCNELEHWLLKQQRPNNIFIYRGIIIPIPTLNFWPPFHWRV